jgi:hypothetical protein
MRSSNCADEHEGFSQAFGTSSSTCSHNFLLPNNWIDWNFVCLQRFEEFIESSQYDGCRLEPKGFVGHWKGIIVRSNRKGDLMGIVTMHPQSLTVEELSAEKERLKEFFLTGSGKDCNLKSLYFQAW